MSLKRTLLVMGAALGLLACSLQAQAAPLLVGGLDNRIDFTNVENLYRPVAPGVAAYVPGIVAPLPGDFLVGIFNITFNNTNGWSSIALPIPGIRDTYTGIFVQKIVDVAPSIVNPGTTTIRLTAPLVGDATTFVGGALGDVSAFSTLGVLSYAASESTAIYHQSGVEPLYKTTGPAGVGNTVASSVGAAISGTPYLTLALLPPVDPAVPGGTPSTPPSTLDYAFSNGTFPPGNFNARGFAGYDIGTVNNTGFSSFTRITDRNINSPLGGPLVQFYLESQLNFNTNGQFNSNPPTPATATSNWDFQSSDPADVLPFNAVPEPATILVMSLGLGLVAGQRVRARRKKLLA